MKNRTAKQTTRPLVEGDDYYWEEAAMVFTAAYHLARGYCCGSGCRHCPYRETESKHEQKKVDERGTRA